MLQRLSGAISSRGVLLLFALVIPAACSLTEEVRTRPGGPGDNPFPASTGGARPETGGDSGLGGRGVDAGPDGDKTDSGGSGGVSGSGGRSHTGGSAGALRDGEAPPDADPEAHECPKTDVTFACHDYCGALSLVPECHEKLRKAAGVRDDGGADFPDGSVPHELTQAEMITRCKCDCELRYRTEACRFDFDQFIMCATPPLTVVCATEPDLVDEIPSVIGPCGSVRSSFVKCFETPPPPPRDGGPS